MTDRADNDRGPMLGPDQPFRNCHFGIPRPVPGIYILGPDSEWSRLSQTANQQVGSFGSGPCVYPNIYQDGPRPATQIPPHPIFTDTRRPRSLGLFMFYLMLAYVTVTLGGAALLMWWAL